MSDIYKLNDDLMALLSAYPDEVQQSALVSQLQRVIGDRSHNKFKASSLIIGEVTASLVERVMAVNVMALTDAPLHHPVVD